MTPKPVHHIRKRMRRWEVPGDIRFITFSCQRRLPLLGNPAIRDVFAQSLDAARRRHGFSLYAWVVMPEHVHLLVRPRPDHRLDAVLRGLKTSVAKRVVARWRELDAPILRDIMAQDNSVRFWQKGGGFDRNVRDSSEFCREVHYIHRNPVERELVIEPQDWHWSSVRWWMGHKGGEVECDPPPGDPKSWERWKGYL
ncbi:MAG TPA: transposase [Phycisphaerales bacterium]|nr:transposase [Phycisphaerales bacterium]